MEMHLVLLVDESEEKREVSGGGEVDEKFWKQETCFSLAKLRR